MANKLNTEWLKLRRRRRRLLSLVLVVFVYICFVVSGFVLQIINYSNESTKQSDSKIIVQFTDSLQVEEEKNCTPRSVDNFPGNFMSLKDTQDGGVFVHIVLILYLFGALAVVCDDYFVPSCEHICTGLKLQEDVAGATFMAAGSSTPEFFTSIIVNAFLAGAMYRAGYAYPFGTPDFIPRVFIAESDVGVGTIVGSAVFNILFIISACALFAGMVVELTWWPMFRDLIFYLLSVLALILTIYDGDVHWYEALVMFLLYIVYIIIMYFNPKLEIKALALLQSCKSRSSSKRKAEDEQPLFQDGVYQSYTDTSETSLGSSSLDDNTTESGFGEDIVEEDLHKVQQINIDKDKEYESPWTIPDGFLLRIFWVAMIPIKALTYVTIPDCRRPGKWRKLYLLTFLCAIIWIAILSYLMVWMVTIAGDALEIPDTVMGLTLLAAGTSVPDCLASILVARDGLGDMAVSNSIGSNIFDILMCLGFPWLLETLIFRNGEHLQINSAGLTYSAIILLSTVAFLLVSTIINQWKLDKKLGAVFIVGYVIVISIACLFELNIFGDFNKPSCPR